MTCEFKTTRRVEFAETDMAGIIHFTSFFRYMEETEHAFFRSLGLSIMTQHKGKIIGWPRVATSCEYYQPIVFEDKIDIHFRVTRKGKSSFTYSFAFYKKGALVARGQSTSVCCTHEDGRSLRCIPIPSFISEKIKVAPSRSDPIPKPKSQRKKTRKSRQIKRKSSR